MLITLFKAPLDELLNTALEFSDGEGLLVKQKGVEIEWDGYVKSSKDKVSLTKALNIIELEADDDCGADLIVIDNVGIFGEESLDYFYGRLANMENKPGVIIINFS